MHQMMFCFKINKQLEILSKKVSSSFIGHID